MIHAVLQDEYVKAYYAAILKKQQELEEAAKGQQELSSTEVTENVANTNSSRQVGMKAKREEDEDDDIEWEEAPIGGETRLFLSFMVFISAYYSAMLYKHLIVR